MVQQAFELVHIFFNLRLLGKESTASFHGRFPAWEELAEELGSEPEIADGEEPEGLGSEPQGSEEEPAASSAFGRVAYSASSVPAAEALLRAGKWAAQQPVGVPKMQLAVLSSSFISPGWNVGRVPCKNCILSHSAVTLAATYKIVFGHAGLRPTPNEAPYAASKWGLQGFSVSAFEASPRPDTLSCRLPAKTPGKLLLT